MGDASRSTDGPEPAETGDDQSRSTEFWQNPTTLPEEIGRYRIKRLLGGGGMGLVYEARQEQPRRTVALKVMRPGITSPRAFQRFRQESQVLARLRHPCIAHVYEAGTHVDPESRQTVPFFAMEYVPAASTLTEYAVGRRLSVRERLQLLIEVCDAVHHGHEKDVIHRDLKPENILVDADGRPRIIDFGVARATDADLAPTTLQTDVGALVGTLQYMSPEQCARGGILRPERIGGDPHDIDRRSDVYSLGMILFELLTGRLPYNVSRLGPYEAARLICEHAIGRPSRIARELDARLDTIALRALSKERGRRYASAHAMARDLEQYLANGPIEARPDSRLYSAWRFVRRHQRVAAAVLVIGTVMVGATAVSTGYGLRAGRAERAAIQSANRYEQITSFFVDDVLDAASPRTEWTENTTVLELLGDAAAAADRIDDRVVRASTLHAIARTYRRLGDTALAKSFTQRALELRRSTLGDDHLDTAETMHHLAKIASDDDEHDLALTLYGEALDIRERLAGPNSLPAAETRHNLGLVEFARGRFRVATDHLNSALGAYRRHVPADDERLAVVLTSLGRVMAGQGRPAEALPFYQEALEIQIAAIGREHRFTAITMCYLSSALAKLDRFDEAERHVRDALEIRERLFPGGHVAVAQTYYVLGDLERERGQFGAAAAWFEQSVAMYERTVSPKHLSIGLACMGHARALHGLDRADEAEALFRRALEIVEDPRWERAVVQQYFGALLLDAGRHDEAEGVLLAAHEVLERRRQSVRAEAVARTLVRLYAAWGRPTDAEHWKTRVE